MSSKKTATSIDQLLREMADSQTSELPQAGGECDTILGWSKRLHISRPKARELIKHLMQQGRAECVRGCIARGRGMYPIDLYRSRALADAAKSSSSP